MRVRAPRSLSGEFVADEPSASPAGRLLTLSRRGARAWLEVEAATPRDLFRKRRALARLLDLLGQPALLRRDLPPLVQAWVELHRDELMADWELAVRGETPYKGAVTWPHEQDIAPEALLAGMVPLDPSLAPDNGLQPPRSACG